MSGNSSVSRRAHEANPNTTSEIIVTTVMIGRLMAKSEMNIARRYGFLGRLVSLQVVRLDVSVSTVAPPTRRRHGFARV